jgi:hypothetical protein
VAKGKGQVSKGRAAGILTLSFCALRFDFLFALLFIAGCLFLTSCRVGPDYKRPPAPVPTAYKELPPPNSAQSSEWAPARPNDAIARGKWWEIYNDPELNALEEQVSLSNQNLKQAEAQFREAKLNVRIARSYLYPTITTSPSIVNSRSAITSSAGVQNFTPSSRTTYDLPVDVSYGPISGAVFAVNIRPLPRPHKLVKPSWRAHVCLTRQNWHKVTLSCAARMVTKAYSTPP